MKGHIKLASVSIKYEEKRRGEKLKEIISKSADILIVINEKDKILKFKKTAIRRVCGMLSLNHEKLINPNINKIDILKDMGKTVYDI